MHSWEERVRLLNLMAKRSNQIESSTRFQSHPLWNAMATALGIFEVDRGAIVTVPEDCNEMAALGERDPMTACWILGRALRPFAVRKASTVQGVRQAWLTGLAQNIRTTTFGQDILRLRREKNNPLLRWALKEAWFSKGDFHAHPEWIIEMDILGIPTQGNILELHEFEEIACAVPGELAKPDATVSDGEVFRTKLLARRMLDAAKH